MRSICRPQSRASRHAMTPGCTLLARQRTRGMRTLCMAPTCQVTLISTAHASALRSLQPCKGQRAGCTLQLWHPGAKAEKHLSVRPRSSMLSVQGSARPSASSAGGGHPPARWRHAPVWLSRGFGGLGLAQSDAASRQAAPAALHFDRQNCCCGVGWLESDTAMQTMAI